MESNFIASQYRHTWEAAKISSSNLELRELDNVRKRKCVRECACVFACVCLSLSLSRNEEEKGGAPLRGGSFFLTSDAVTSKTVVCVPSDHCTTPAPPPGTSQLLPSRPLWFVRTSRCFFSPFPKHNRYLIDKPVGTPKSSLVAEGRQGFHLHTPVGFFFFFFGGEAQMKRTSLLKGTKNTTQKPADHTSGVLNSEFFLSPRVPAQVIWLIHHP